MDPFGDGSGNDGDLSQFQAPADGSYSNDFYEVDSAATSYDPNFDPTADPLAEDQPVAPMSYEQPPAHQEEYVEAAPMSYEAPPAAEPVSYTSPAAPVSMPQVEEDNELTKFMREYEQKIAEKAVEQEKVAVESKAKAQQDMQTFLSDRHRIKETKQQSNRQHEQATMEKLAADLESNNPWERVVNLVDLDTNSRKKRLEALNKESSSSKKKGQHQHAEPEPSKQQAKKEEEEDVSRMRQLFVQLKAEPLEKTRSA